MAKIKKTKKKAISKDTGDSIISENASWSFSGSVAKHFDAHVKRSVPLYDDGHALIEKVSDFYLSDGSICYDLGCSTGKLISALGKRHAPKDIKFIGIEKEGDMVGAARNRCKQQQNIKILESDLLDVEFEKSDLIIAYYTIQFVSPKNRQILFDRFYRALNWGGGLLLFEKVRAKDARFQDMMSALYVEYKFNEGYSSDQILAKARSLKGILEPFSTQGNLDLMMRAGFVDIATIMKYVCFEGFLAVK